MNIISSFHDVPKHRYLTDHLSFPFLCDDPVYACEGHLCIILSDRQHSEMLMMDSLIYLKAGAGQNCVKPDSSANLHAVQGHRPTSLPHLLPVTLMN